MALYPPVVASSMPAFDIKDKEVRIYFTLSSYNSVSDIAAAHVSVRRQSSNVNVLNTTSEIIQKTIQQDAIDRALNRYYITILDSDIKPESSSSSNSESNTNTTNFKVDVLYKVQIRLSSVVKADGEVESDFFTNNIEKFSQWSTVCIIKPINVPQFFIDNFYVDGQQAQEEDQNDYSFDFADFTGVYKANESSQVLKNWRIRLLKSTYSKDELLNIDEYTLADSGWNIISAYNYTLDSSSVTFHCSLPYVFSESKDTSYKLFFEIKTKNDYEGSILYSFNYTGRTQKKPDGKIVYNINEEEGYIKVAFSLNAKGTDEDETIKNYVLRRTDSKKEFKKWEDLIFFTWSQQQGEFDYYDFTTQSGTLYAYCVQYVDTRGRRYSPLINKDNQSGKVIPVMAEWQNAFLLQSNLYGQTETTKQLKLKFDFQISSYKTNIAESRIDTIGSRYPYIRRNGNMYYRSFPCSGTITGYMDNADLFVAKEKVLENNSEYYNTFQGYNEDYYANKYDYTYERKFREYVQEFLYNVKPKLYKSMQEGNILIKLMDVSLTPKTQLGRLIYTFSATAYEIGQYSISNLDANNIIQIGQYDSRLGHWIEKEYTDQQGNIVKQIDHVQQLVTPSDGTFKAGQDIIGTETTPAANSIATINNYGVVNIEKETAITDIKVKYLRIEVESDPYLIIQDKDGLRPADDIMTDGSFDDLGPLGNGSPTINQKLYQMQSTLNGKDVYLGTLFTINGQKIIVAPPNNIYQIREDDLGQITNLSIVPAKDTKMIVNYVVNLWQENDMNSTPKIKRNNRINSQTEGVYTAGTDLVNLIKLLHTQEYITDQYKVKRNFIGIRTITIDTEPGTVVQIDINGQPMTETVNGQEVPINFIVNDTGQFVYDVSTQDENYITSFTIVGKRINENQITFLPQEVWNKEENRYEYSAYGNNIYYRRTVYTLTAFGDEYYIMDCPIEALVYYYAMEGEEYY